ncbi:MAG: squalene/phytoene synthase family protein [Candidatus Baltobacteraceae bacterium]
MNPFSENNSGLREAERFCSAMARREAKNFYWGFISLPYDQRIAIYALYDFARQIDDEADAAGPEGLADRLMGQRARLERALLGEYSDPVMRVLGPAVERYSIPHIELHQLIDGVAMDVDTSRYQTWEELQHYCRLVASVVGRMCVRIFGFQNPIALQHTDELGVALQLINILRDVREDAQMGRIYLPQEDLNRFGIAERDLLASTPGSAWQSLVAFEVARARTLWQRGQRVLEYIPTRPGVCVATMGGIYRRILEQIASDPELPLRGRASLSGREKLAVVIQAWLQTR